MKVALVFGTRPEAIKMAPVYHELKKSDTIEVITIITGQHKKMLDQVIDFFLLKVDYDLSIMTENQTLDRITSSILTGLMPVFAERKIDLVLVHGDTTTTFAATLAAFYNKIPVGHVEAGLRSHNIYSPYPEEINRKLTSAIAKYHFAPTNTSRENLLKENVNGEDIIITGNTVIDALFLGLELNKEKGTDISQELLQKIENRKMILVTGHRRENFGDGFKNICSAIKIIAEKFSEEVHIVYPVHLNPNVREIVFEQLNTTPNISLIEPLDYPSFITLMSKSYIILTDSGGIQEEAPSIGKPVLVMRDTTERPEGVDAGTVKLVGTSIEKIVSNVESLITNPEHYTGMSKIKNPYGDGQASIRIRTFIEHLS